MATPRVAFVVSAAVSILAAFLLASRYCHFHLEAENFETFGNDAATKASVKTARKTTGNMNGLYEIQNSLKNPHSFNTDYSARGHRYFDVYSPEISSTYGENTWRDLGHNPLPPGIVDKFRDGTIAITGYEHDQVLVDPPGKPGLHPERDVSVPFTWSYNHHYMIFMTGRGSDMAYVDVGNNALMGDITATYHHGGRSINSTHTRIWRPIGTKLTGWDDEDAMDGGGKIPTYQFFSEANGGESRKSYHGYPTGYAQLLTSPEMWHVTPMQIDTRNRQCGIKPDDILNSTACPIVPEENKYFYPGPEPKQSRYGRAGMLLPHSEAHNLTYASGILECPCTSRWGGDATIYGTNIKTKAVRRSYEVIARNKCNGADSNPDLHIDAKECFDAVAGMLPLTQARVVKNKTVDDGGNRYPVGCSVKFNGVVSSEKATVPTAYFNSAPTSNGVCSTDVVSRVGTALFDMLGTSVHVELKADDENHNGKVTVQITMTGPSDRWFAFAFNATRMVDKPYALLVESAKTGSNTDDGHNDGDGFVVNERILGTCGDEAGHCVSEPILPATVKIIRSEVDNATKRRTVVVQRDAVVANFDGTASNRHYNFEPAKQSSIQMLSAHGVDGDLGVAYHGPNHQMGELSLFDQKKGSSNCVCVDSTRSASKLCDAFGEHCVEFVKHVSPPCLDSDKSDECGSLETQKNPTITPTTYSGGLSCCGDGRVLLDADQERGKLIGADPKQPLRYHMKIRFWYQDYSASGHNAADNIRETLVEYKKDSSASTPSHQNLIRLYYQTENAAGEYDVPPAFRESKDKPIPGYPDWPLNTPTPGTNCTLECWDESGTANVHKAGCSCTHEIIRKFPFQVGQNSPNKGVKLIYANGHCHAPSCISMHLYRRKRKSKTNRGASREDAADVRASTPRNVMKSYSLHKGFVTNDGDIDLSNYELICVQEPRYGEGDLFRDKFDDKGYIRTPPCLWSDDESDRETLPRPPTFRWDDELLSIKKNRNTYVGHYGEMASWQMRGVVCDL